MSAVSDAIAVHFGVQRAQAKIVAVLYDAGADWVKTPEIVRLCGAASEPAVRVHAHWLRRRGVAIEAHKTKGYRISEELCAECRLAFGEQAARHLELAHQLSEAAA